MASTYLKLVNDVLIHLNQVPLSVNTFDDARALHLMVKNSVNKSILYINSQYHEWPFNAYEHSHPLIKGKTEYAWPLYFKSVDWDSFEIEKDVSLDVNTTHLDKINRDDWYYKFRDLDQDAGSDGRELPRFVFESHGTGFGVTPSPNEVYNIKYRYFVIPNELVNHDDRPTIPSEWDHVIFLGALWFGNLFNENPDGMAAVKQEFKEMINSMRRILINKQDDMRSTVINNGGGPYRGLARTVSPSTWE